MATLTLRGFCVEVDPITEVGANNTKKQLMRITIPARTDDFGIVKGKPQQWELTALGDQVAKLSMDKTMVDKKVEVNCYADSYLVESKEAGKEPFYSVNINIASIKIIP
jgi:hypothetical protein